MTKQKTFELLTLLALAVVAGAVFRHLGSNIWPGVSASVCLAGLSVMGVKITQGVRPTLFIMAVVVAAVNLTAVIPV